MTIPLTTSCHDLHQNPALPRDIRYIRSPHPHGLEYFCCGPSSSGQPAGIVVAIHGISRQAREQIEAHAALAGFANHIIIAPVFSRESFPDYQRLGISQRRLQPRADLALQDVLSDIRRLYNLPETAPIILSGYSGGAQFAQRYALACPEQVNALILGAPGWYTLPIADRKFPYGLKDYEQIFGRPFPATTWISVPTLIVVGVDDTQRDEALRISDWLDYVQGPHRRARAESYLAILHHLGKHKGSHHLQLISECAHSFKECAQTEIWADSVNYIATARSGGRNSGA